MVETLPVTAQADEGTISEACGWTPQPIAALDGVKAQQVCKETGSDYVSCLLSSSPQPVLQVRMFCRENTVPGKTDQAPATCRSVAPLTARWSSQQQTKAATP